MVIADPDVTTSTSLIRRRLPPTPSSSRTLNSRGNAGREFGGHARGRGCIFRAHARIDDKRCAVGHQNFIPTVSGRR